MRTADPDFAPKPHTINLAQGEQAVVNGAMVTASTACTLEVGSGAFVLTGRSLWKDHDPLRNPSEELYFSLLDASVSAEHFENERFRLFALLAQVVLQKRTHEAQQECALCASALIAGNAEDATGSAARLASGRLRSTEPQAHEATRRKKRPGQTVEKRSDQVNHTAQNPQLTA